MRCWLPLGALKKLHTRCRVLFKVFEEVWFQRLRAWYSLWSWDQPGVQCRGPDLLSYFHGAITIFSSSIAATTVEETRHWGVCTVLDSISSSMPLSFAIGEYFEVEENWWESIVIIFCLGSLLFIFRLGSFFPLYFSPISVIMGVDFCMRPI